MDGSEAEGDLVLIQTFRLYYVNQVILMLTSIFKNNFHNKAERVCIKTRSPSASLPSITVKWPILTIIIKHKLKGKENKSLNQICNNIQSHLHLPLLLMSDLSTTIPKLAFPVKPY